MTLLQEAESLINGQRKEDYGDAKACFKRIATFWSGYLSVRCDVEITPHDVAHMMVLFKMARLAQSPEHHDSILDGIGYLALTEHIDAPRASRLRSQGQLQLPKDG